MGDKKIDLKLSTPKSKSNKPRAFAGGSNKGVYVGGAVSKKVSKNVSVSASGGKYFSSQKSKPDFKAGVKITFSKGGRINKIKHRSK